MNYLDSVKEKIADYIVREPVEETEEVISAYTLFSALKDYKRRLRHVEEIEKGLVDKLNGIYPQRTVKEKKGMFKKKTKVNHFDHAWHGIESNKTYLAFWRSDDSGDTYLEKDYMFADIYSINEGLTEEAYNECSEEIHTIFNELEYFGLLYYHDNQTDTRIRISCDGFDLKIYTGMMEIDYGIELNEKIAPNGHTDAYFYGKDNDIEKTINDNMEAILKNTPVRLKNLSFMPFMLVTDYREKQRQITLKEEVQKVLAETKMNED